MSMAKKQGNTQEPDGAHPRRMELVPSEAPSELLRELVVHLRQNRTQLREEWVSRIGETRLLTAMTKEEIFAEATSVYDSYVEALETETFEALQAYARNLSERIIPRGVETHEVVGIVLLLRDVLARSLFAKHQTDFRKLNRIVDAYEPAANRDAASVQAYENALADLEFCVEAASVC
jgi:rsbT co-antagonist protein RsbR